MPAVDEIALDKIICEIHQYVESIGDKESAFILSVGMKPYVSAK